MTASARELEILSPLLHTPGLRYSFLHVLIHHCFSSLSTPIAYDITHPLAQAMASTPPNTSSEKVSASPDAGYASHNESSKNEKLAQDPEPEIIDSSGRRKSVALNIVENPLKVSFTSRVAALMMLILIALIAFFQSADRRQCPYLC